MFIVGNLLSPRRLPRPLMAILAAAAILSWANGLQAAAQPATTRAAVAPAPAAPPLPRLTAEKGQFIDKSTGQVFQPRGVNYIRLNRGWHSTFAPDQYDAQRAQAMFDDIQANGFNLVRVFIDPNRGEGIAGDASIEGLSPAYMANFLDFLERARAHKVYVVTALCGMPSSRRYNDITGGSRRGWGRGNDMYLNPKYGQAKAQFCADFAAAIKQHDPGLLSTMFAYELDNETNLTATGVPFGGEAGIYKWNGQDYDASKDDDLQRLADEAVIQWADGCVDAVKAVDPDAMVSINVFTFAAVGRSGPAAFHRDQTNDRRFPARPLALTRTKLAYLDIHFYPFNNETLDRDLASIEFLDLKKACEQTGQPLIMGEFGAFKGPYPTVAVAAAAMKRHLERVESLGFVGFMYWTYDTDEQRELWNAKSDKDDIFQILKANHEAGQADAQ